MYVCVCKVVYERKISAIPSGLLRVVQKEFNSVIFWSVKKILQSQLFRLHPITHANRESFLLSIFDLSTSRRFLVFRS